jgi:hypothetical protein
MAAGIQYWRINSPIGVPGPTRVNISWFFINLSLFLSIIALGKIGAHYLLWVWANAPYTLDHRILVSGRVIEKSK